eukprot:6115390-Heterocapsa_arctica.AAC.1
MADYTNKTEKDGGTRITSTNLSGSQFDFEFMLDQCTDHVTLIQEHWRLKEELLTWQTLAHLKGWQGIWEPAKLRKNIKMESLVDQEEL